MPAGVRPPNVGELVISEIMADPTQPVEDRNGEWFEVHNLANEPVSLSNCTVADAAVAARGLARPEVGAFIQPGGYLTFVRSTDPAINGGISGGRSFDFGLTNDGDEIIITCADIEMHRVNFAADGFPTSKPGRAIQLAPMSLDPQSNDAGAAWCDASVGYPISVAAPDQFGTPQRFEH